MRRSLVSEMNGITDILGLTFTVKDEPFGQ